MKKLTNFIFVFFLYSTGFAQEIPLPKITKSEIFKDEFKNSNIKSINSDGKGGIIIVRSQKDFIEQEKIYNVQTFDKNLKLISQKEYNISDNPKEIRRYMVLGVIADNDNVHIIDYYYNDNTKRFVCSAKTTSESIPNFIEKELFSFDGDQNFESTGKSVLKAYGSLFGIGNTDLYENYAKMMISNNKNSFAISIKMKDKKSEKFKMFAFTKKLEKKLEHDFDTKVKNRNFDFNDFDLSADGNSIFLISQVKNEITKKKKDGGKYQFILSQITTTSEKNIIIDPKDHYCQGLSLLTNNNFLKCVGFYSDKNDYRFKGIAVFNINPNDLSIKNTKYNPFTAQFSEDKFGKVKDKELRNLKINDFRIAANGEIIINAEERFTTTSTTNFGGAGGMSSRTILHLNDIVSVKLNAENELVWARNINKVQSTSGQGQNEDFLSFTSANVGANNYLFINASEKPTKLSNNRIKFKETSRSKYNINMIRFDEKGEFDFIEILDNKQNEMPFLLGRGVQIENSVYFLGRDGKKKQLLKVTI